jgi:small subunit ribosomal protein S19
MTRSVWKGPFIANHLMKKVVLIKSSGKNTILKTWSRSSTIIPMFVGITFAVHNGNKFIPVFVNEDMVGKKFGEFSPTRTFKGHGGDKKAKV